MRAIDVLVPASEQEERRLRSEWASKGVDRPVLVALK